MHAYVGAQVPRRMTIVVLLPPKPYEFDITVRSSPLRLMLGT
jgi:hypothetical protein